MTRSAEKQSGERKSSDTVSLSVLVEELIQCIQAGQVVDSGFLAERFPDHAEKLRELLPTIQAMADLSRSSDSRSSQLEDPLAHRSEIDPAGAATLGDFRIVRQIGRGGMGIVYEAQQISLRRRVALKILPFAGILDQRQLARFKNESLAAAALDHPHIVPVHAVGCERGVHYYAMRFVDGHNLAELIRELRIREGFEVREHPAAFETESLAKQLGVPSHDAGAVGNPLDRDAGPGSDISRLGERQASCRMEPGPDAASPLSTRPPLMSTLGAGKESTHASRSQRLDYYRNIAQLGVQAAEALAHAHEEGVIHRDIKPSNLILDTSGNVWVTDFGLARTRTAASMTLTGDLVGTLRYMSPEQAMATRVPVDHRTDIYSLGATLYELLTLQPMLSGEDQADLLRKIAHGEPVPPRRLRSDIPVDLETIVLKAVSKDPGSRFASASEFAEDLTRYLNDCPIQARRPSLGQHVGRWFRRHRATVTVGTLAALAVLLASLMVLLQQNAELVRQRNRATANATAAQDATDDAIRQRNLAQRAEQDAKRAQQIAESERVRAEQHAQGAIGAVKHFGDVVAGNLELKNSAQLESLRNELLREPLAFFQTLRERLQSEQDNRPESLARLADAVYLLAMLTSEIGDRQDALRAYEEAATIAEPLARENPTVAEFGGKLAVIHNNIGGLLRETGQPVDALAAYEHARGILEQLVRENPTITEFQNNLALTLNNIGFLLGETGKPTEALAICERARVIAERLARESPKVVEFRSHLAKSHIGAGVQLSTVGRPAEALEAYQQAREILEQLTQENPAAADFQSDLVMSLHNIGILLSEFGKPTEAIAALEQGRRIAEQLVQKHPTVTAFQRCLADSYINLGRPLRAVGRQAEVLEAHEQARAILERLAIGNPAVTDFQRDLAAIYLNLGILRGDSGMSVEAMAACEQAREIFERLAKENPTHTDFRRSLAVCQKRIGMLLGAAGKRTEALTTYEQAQAIRERLVRENPNDAELRRDLADGYNTIGSGLREMGRRTEALAAFEQAREIFERLARENPTVTEFWSQLATGHYGIGTLLLETGKPTEALASYQQALEIRERLSRDNPSNIDYQSRLATSHHALGVLLQADGKLAEAQAAFEQALVIEERLVRENPSVILYLRHLSVTQANLTRLDLDAARFSQARDRILRTVEKLKRVIAARPQDLEFRKFLNGCYAHLVEAASGLNDAELAREARKGLAELARSDLQGAGLEHRIAAVLKGEETQDTSERLTLAKRAFVTGRFALAARFVGEALTNDVTLAENREIQHAYNAACFAVLAVSDENLDDPPPDDAAKATLRGQALTWLQEELVRWETFLAAAKPEQCTVVAQTLKRWQTDLDLASVREPAKLAALPDDERSQWVALWKRVEELLAKASQERGHRSP